MDMVFLGRGLVVGFAIAAPVGAIGLLCIRRTLTDGRLVGFVSGLGAASADALYGLLAAMGLRSVSSVLMEHQSWVRLAGGLFLCYLGVRTVTTRPSVEALAPSGRGLAIAYGSTFALTLTNPSTILSFAAVFSGMGLVDTTGDRWSAGLLVLGVFLGSALWWLLLSGGIGWVRRSLTPSGLRWVNLLSGAALAGLGLLALVSLWG